MEPTSPYYRQVALLVRALPYVANETCFALKDKHRAINDLLGKEMREIYYDRNIAAVRLKSF